MSETKAKTLDPICGMAVDPSTALHAECEGKTSYFCSDACRRKFLAAPGGDKPEKKGCC